MATIQNLARTDRRSPSTGVVCHCFGVTESEIREAIQQHDLETAEQVTERTLAGAGCTACRRRIQRILQGLPPTCGVLSECRDCGLQAVERTKSAA